jgi:hypothetical protein
MRRLALIALLLVACGEAGDPGSPDAGAGRMELALGTVDGAGQGFLPLEGDQPLVPGAQGGFHVWLKYRVSGHVAGTFRVKRTARRVADGRLVLLTEGNHDLQAPGEGGHWELPSPLPSFMCPSPIGVSVVDQPIRFTVEVYAPDGTLLGTGSAEATPRCPDGEQQEWCLRICQG